MFLPALVRPAPAAMRGFLWCLTQGRRPVPPPLPGRVSLPAGRLPREYWEQVGFRRFGKTALRIDMVERIAARAWDLAKAGGKAGFEISPDLLSLAGCGAAEMAQILRGLGFKGREVEGALRFRPAARRTATNTPTRGKAKGRAKANTPAPPAAPKVDPHSPFAKLKDLVLS
ncbi:MAG: hypothetical protein CMF64_05385 [Magnetovibrio sp.]|nr:hypothetical protein [Magnetovibrio sp.]